MMQSILLWHSTMTDVWILLILFAAFLTFIGIKEYLFFQKLYNPKLPTPEEQAKEFIEFQKEVEAQEAFRKKYIKEHSASQDSQNASSAPPSKSELP